MNPVSWRGHPAEARKRASSTVIGQSAPAPAIVAMATIAGTCSRHARGWRITTTAPPTSTTTNAPCTAAMATARAPFTRCAGEAAAGPSGSSIG